MVTHDSLLSDPHQWREIAYGQLYVADALDRARKDLVSAVPSASDRRVEDVAFFGALAYHLGMALELAAKGAIAESTRKIPPFHHKLVPLCADAGLKLTTEETDLLERLTAAIEWWGRYAAPKSYSDYIAARRRPIRTLRLPRERRMVGDLLRRLGCSAT